jgi:hypothetical protein
MSGPVNNFFQFEGLISFRIPTATCRAQSQGPVECGDLFMDGHLARKTCSSSVAGVELVIKLCFIECCSR